MSFTLRDPTKSLYTMSGRRLNYRFFALETLGYIAGAGDRAFTNLLCSVNSNLKPYVNPSTGAFDGAYGPRFKRSLRDVVEILSRDNDSRQAVASIWKPGIPLDSLDVPCTVALHFFNSDRNNASPTLDLAVYMRSNDMNWGFPYDVPAFCAIQCAVAAALGWGIGSYHHVVGSAHVYVASLPDLEFLGEELPIRLPTPAMPPSLAPGTAWSTYSANAGVFVQEAIEHLDEMVSDEQLVNWREFRTSLAADDRSAEECSYWAAWEKLVWIGRPKPGIPLY
jgi:hypothetical protein